MKILNLYCGIGGNRKLWGEEHEVTAVELDPKIAAIYKDVHPTDNVVVGDAHEYLLKHFQEFDFIWASPPCPTHSRMRMNHKIKKYPDLKLYEEIILLKHFFKGLWIIENVIPYYEHLIKPTKILHRHSVWCNFNIEDKDFPKLGTCKILNEREFLQQQFGYNLDKYSGVDKRLLLRNCVVPEMGLHILESAFKENVQQELRIKNEVRKE